MAEVDLSPVLALIAEHNPSMNKFIVEGTDRRFDSEPCTIKISNDWWLNNALSTPTMAAVPAENFNCPFNSRPDCRSKNKVCLWCSFLANPSGSFKFISYLAAHLTLNHA